MFAGFDLYPSEQHRAVERECGKFLVLLTIKWAVGHTAISFFGEVATWCRYKSGVCNAGPGGGEVVYGNGRMDEPRIALSRVCFGENGIHMIKFVRGSLQFHDL